MTKEEILEALDVYEDATCLFDPESIPTKREDFIAGEKCDILFEKCCKYRQPLIDYIYRDNIGIKAPF